MGLYIKDIYKNAYNGVSERERDKIISLNPDVIFQSNLGIGEENLNYRINGEINNYGIMIYGCSLDVGLNTILTSLANGSIGNSTLEIKRNGEVSSIGLSENLNPTFETNVKGLNFIQEQMEIEYFFKKFCTSLFGENLELFENKAKLIKEKHLEDSFSNLVQQACVIYNMFIPSYEEYKKNPLDGMETISRQEWICQNETFREELSKLCRGWGIIEIVESSKDTNVARDTLESQRASLETIVRNVDKLLNAKIEFLSPKGKDKGAPEWIKYTGNSLVDRMNATKKELGQINFLHEKAIKGTLTREESEKYEKFLIQVQKNLDYVIDRLLIPEKEGNAESIRSNVYAKAMRLSKHSENFRKPMDEILNKVKLEANELANIKIILESSREQLDNLKATYNGQTILLTSREVLKVEKLKDEDYIGMREKAQKAIEAYVEKVELARKYPGKTQEETKIMMEAIEKDTENIRKILFDLNTQSGGGDWLKHLDPGTKAIISNILTSEDSSNSNKLRIELGYLTKDEVFKAITKYSNEIEEKKQKFDNVIDTFNQSQDENYSFKNLIVEWSGKESPFKDALARENLAQYNKVLEVVVNSPLFDGAFKDYNRSLEDKDKDKILNKANFVIDENGNNLKEVGECFSRLKTFISENPEVQSRENYRDLKRTLDLISTLEVSIRGVDDLTLVNPDSLKKVVSHFGDKLYKGGEVPNIGDTAHQTFLANAKVYYLTCNLLGDRLVGALNLNPKEVNDTLKSLSNIVTSMVTNPSGESIEKLLSKTNEEFIKTIKDNIEGSNLSNKQEVKNLLDMINNKRDIATNISIEGKLIEKQQSASIENQLENIAEKIYNRNVFVDTFNRFAKDNPNYLAIFGKDASPRDPMRQLLNRYLSNDLLKRMDNREFLAVFEVREALQKIVTDKTAQIKSLTPVKTGEESKVTENLSPDTLERLERILMFIEIDCIGKGILGESGFDNVNKETVLNFLSGDLGNHIAKLSETNEKRMEFVENANSREDLELLKAFYKDDNESSNTKDAINDKFYEIIAKDTSLQQAFKKITEKDFKDVDKESLASGELFERLITSLQDDKDAEKLLKAYREATKQALNVEQSEESEERRGLFGFVNRRRKEKENLDSLKEEVKEVMENTCSKDFSAILEKDGEVIKERAISIDTKIEIEFKNVIFDRRQKDNALETAIQYANNNLIDGAKVVDLDKPVQSQITKLEKMAANGDEIAKEALENIIPIVEVYKEVASGVIGEDIREVRDLGDTPQSSSIRDNKIKEEASKLVTSLEEKGLSKEEMEAARFLLVGPQGLADLRRYTILKATVPTLKTLIENKDESFMKSLEKEKLFDFVTKEAKTEALQEVFEKNKIPFEIKQIAINNFIENEIKPLVEYEKLLKESILNVLEDEKNEKFFDSVEILSIESFKQERDNLLNASLSEDETKIYSLLKKNGLNGFDCAYVLENKETFDNSFKELMKTLELVENADDMTLKDVDINEFLKKVAPIILKANLGEDGIWNKEFDGKVSSNEVLKEIENLNEKLEKLEEIKDDFLGETVDITEESSMDDVRENLSDEKVAMYVSTKELLEAVNVDGDKILDDEKLEKFRNFLGEHLLKKGLEAFDEEEQSDIAGKILSIIDRDMLDRISQHFDGKEDYYTDNPNKENIAKLKDRAADVLAMGEAWQEFFREYPGEINIYMKALEDAFEASGYDVSKKPINSLILDLNMELSIRDIDATVSINGEEFNSSELKDLSKVINILNDETLSDGEKTKKILGEDKDRHNANTSILKRLDKAIQKDDELNIEVIPKEYTFSEIQDILKTDKTINKQEFEDFVTNRIKEEISKTLIGIENIDSSTIANINQTISKSGNGVNEEENINDSSFFKGEESQRKALNEYGQDEVEIKVVEQEQKENEYSNKQEKEEALFDELSKDILIKEMKANIPEKIEDINSSNMERILFFAKVGDEDIKRNIEEFSNALDKKLENLSEEDKIEIKEKLKEEIMNKDSDAHKEFVGIITTIENLSIEQREDKIDVLIANVQNVTIESSIQENVKNEAKKKDEDEIETPKKDIIENGL